MAFVAIQSTAAFGYGFGGHRRFRTGFLARRRQALRTLLEHGRDRGELPTSVDLDFLVELVFASLWYRILVRHQPLSRRFADQLADAVLALATPG